MKRSSASPGVRLRIVLADDIAIGPGKAALLENLRDTGSIAAAGRRMGMSYKRAWMLVDTMNRCFAQPLVATARGGARRGGAVLTETGAAVLAAYRRMEALAGAATADELAALRGLLADPGKGRE